MSPSSCFTSRRRHASTFALERSFFDSHMSAWCGWGSSCCWGVHICRRGPSLDSCYNGSRASLCHFRSKRCIVWYRCSHTSYMFCMPCISPPSFRRCEKMIVGVYCLKNTLMRECLANNAGLRTHA